MIYFTAKHDLISSKDSYLFMKFVCALPAPVFMTGDGIAWNGGCFYIISAKNKTKVLIFSQRLLRMNKKQNFMQCIPAEGGLLL